MARIESGSETLQTTGNARRPDEREISSAACFSPSRFRSTSSNSAPACANFQPGLAQGAKEVTDGGPPIHILTGADDGYKDAVNGQKPGIEGQADWAQECFTKLKFTHVKRTMLPATGHSNCVKEVWAFLDEVLAATK